MKYIRKITWIGIMIAVLASCQDDQIEQYEPLTGPKPDPTVSWLEYLKSYGDLKTYIDRAASPDFKLGAGILLPEFIAQGDKYNLYLANFDQITLGNEMKHDNIVQADGTLNLTNVSNLISAAKAVGMSVYGHTLVWHSQQRASYLNSLIAPTIIDQPAGSNLLTNGSFEDDMTGWGQWGGGSTNEIVTGGAPDGDKMLKITVPNAGDTWSVQLRTPTVSTIVGHQYEVSFSIKSDEPGGLRLSIGGDGQMSNRWPQHKDAISGSKDNILATSSTWQQIVFSTNTIASGDPWVATGESVQFDLDLGQIAGVYYIDNVIVVDLDEEVDKNLLPAGGFESGNLAADGWQTKNPGAGIEITTEEVRTGKYAVKLTAGASSVNDWDLQLGAPSIPVIKGNQYEISFYIKSNVDGKGRLSFGSSMSNNYPYVSGAREFTTGKDWTKVIYSPETIGADWATAADALQIDFDLGTVPNVTYYIDDVTVLEVTPDAKSSILRAAAATIVIEKTPEEKKEIITAELEKWIKGIMEVAGDYVKDWDVVNEPMDDGKPNELKTTPATPGASEFYWQDYLGKEYAATATTIARKYASNLRLFINDYNLEYSLDKCKGLIDFVKYTDDVCQSMGVKGVDGIGTQMHLSVTENRNNIEEMFKLLAATGKLIKITELDMGLGGNPAITTPDATQDLYKAQADLYQFVVQKYFELIPAAQRAGITLWSPIDSPDTPYTWRRNEPIGLWNLEFVRKPAYGGFANGLAGRDISANP